MIISATYLARPKSLKPGTWLFYHVSIIHSLGKYVRKIVSMLQKRLCWNTSVTMATPQIFYSQPSILYPRIKKIWFLLCSTWGGVHFFPPSWPFQRNTVAPLLTRKRFNIVGSLCERQVASSASDRQGSNFESCVWWAVLSHSS